MSWPIISEDPAVQAFYEQMRRAGQSHLLAEMFALQAPPQSNSDREFLEGHCNGSQFQNDPKRGNYYAKVAKKAGVSTTGKVYMPGLAAYPGDPQAWVSDRHDVQKVCEQRGYNCEGAVKVKSEIKQVQEAPRLAEDIVQRKVKQYVAKDPAIKKRPKQELREMVIEKHGRRK